MFGFYLLLGITAALALALYRLVALRLHKDEPPLVKGWPILGQLPGILCHGTSLQDVLGPRTNHLPVYTMTVLGQRMYTITSPHLASVIVRKQRHLDTETQFTTTVFKNMIGVDNHSMELLMPLGEPGSKMTRSPFREEMRNVEHKTLASNQSMQHLAAQMVTDIISSMNAATSQKETEIQLLKFLESSITTGAARSLYGPRSPFDTTPSLVNDYWEFDSNISVFLIGLFPKYFVPKSYMARERLAEAFTRYHRRGDGQDSSDVIRRRVEICRQHNLSEDYLGRSELELVNGLLSNMVPTIFWMLLHITSSGLNDLITNEISSITTTPEGGSNMQLDIGSVREKAPLLVATFKEVLRLYASSARAYQIIEDFYLTDEYLLKKGSMVTIPTEVLHKNPLVWGPDVLEFNHTRWLKGAKAIHSAAWAPFGGGSSICPGRHLVFIVIMATVAILLYDYDFNVSLESGDLPRRRTKIMSGVRLPEKDVLVTLRYKKSISPARKWAVATA